MSGLHFTGGVMDTGNVTNLNLIEIETYGTGAGTIGTMTGLNIASLGLYNSPTTMKGINIAANTNAVGTSKYGIYIGNQAGASTNNYAIYSLGGINYFAGSVGIGMSPTHQLQLSTDDAAKPTSNTWTIVSDSRLKQNVQNFNDGLNVISQINPVSYELNGKAGTPYGAKGISVIAQDVKDIIPYTISTFQAKLNPEDVVDTTLYDFNSSALTFVAINAIKELNLNLEAISGTILPLAGSSSDLPAQTGSFVTAFFNNVFAKVTTWMGEATNGITKFFVGEIDSNKSTTKNLCVSNGSGETCITRDQLDALLAGAGGSSSGSGSSSSGGSGNTLPTETCSDNIQNQDETGIDTGGVCTPAVTVTLDSIAITTSATKLSYAVGETLDITGLVITGTYRDATTKVETVTSDNVSGFDSSAPATGQILTVTIGEKTTTYTIDVITTE
jgi:hypothetical protein